MHSSVSLHAKQSYFSGKLKDLFEGVGGLENSPMMDHSQLSGIHPFMSAESITLDSIVSKLLV